MVRLRTLGAVDLRDADGRELRTVLAQPKRLALLAYLAVARPRGFHRRDTLLALFWPELDAGRARDALSQALRFLRQALGADALVSRGIEEVGLAPERVTCDAVRLDDALDAGRHVDAVALYGGDFLAGVHVAASAELDEWVERERARLRAGVARAARACAEACDRDGRHTAAVSSARRAVELSDRDERLVRELIDLLARLGDRAGALHAYESFARRLAEEYDASPSPETRALIDRVRAQEAEPPRPTRPPARRDGATRVAGRAPIALSPDATPPTIPGYAIERELGRGGMSIVYLARDARHDRRVAVKVIRPELATAGGSARFAREVRITARLAHPHVLPLLDSGEADGLLYYVTPFVEGETLRARLAAAGALSVADAVRVGGEVARALDYAHRAGIVHRDVKPENVLLADGHAVVADFGVARALAAPADGATEPGSVVGSRAYMSPEQASGDPAVDARADVYALGCLLYEMLAGAPPASAFVAGRSTDVRRVRAEVPDALASLVTRCLERDRERRPATAAAVVDALDAVARTLPSNGAVRGTPRRPVRRARMAALVVLAAVAGVAASRVAARAGAGRAALAAPMGAPGVAATIADLDGASIAVLPFDGDTVSGGGPPVSALVQESLRRWRGVTVLDAAGAASGARHVVRGTVWTAGDSLHVRATLLDARRDASRATASVRLARGAAVGERAVAGLVARLLFPAVDSATHAVLDGRTTSVRAFAAFADGMAAVREWELRAADSAFAAAADADGDLALASLWLAQVRSWQRAPPPRWQAAAERAARGANRLTAHDRALADALLARAEGRFEAACPAWERLAAARPDDFAAWHGLATCLRGDSVVVRDAASPSGWRFRASYRRMLDAQRRAYRLMPSIHRGLAERSFAAVRRSFFTGRNMLRGGRAAAPDTTAFFALPSWSADTLAFVPYSGEAVRALAPRAGTESAEEALKHQRLLFRDVAVEWVAAYPSSAPAMEALALALEMLGDRASLDSLRRARALAIGAAERRRLAAAEAWLRVKLALPDDLASLRAAAAIADSLLGAAPTSPAEAELLASLAALGGRAARAAELARAAHEADPDRTPRAVTRPAWALLAFAALGAPADSLRALEAAVGAAIDGTVPAARQHEERLQWLARAATLAFPTTALASIRALSGRGDPLLDAQAAAERGDTVAARRALADLAARRTRLRPSDLTLDALHPESALLARLGDARAAIDWLDPALGALPATQPHALANVVAAGSLVRAIALRAELAERTGDRAGARRWASAAAALWTHADPALAPVVARMRRLAR